MPNYKAIFRVPGGTELRADKGYVPDAFFSALQHVTANDIVYKYEGGFVLSNEIHELLNTPSTFTSYASVGNDAPEGTSDSEAFLAGLLQKLKMANHARPVETHYHYQVFIMEYIEPVIDDD